MNARLHPDAIERSLWFATAPPPPATAPLSETLDCDVATVGARIFRLSAALALARAGRSVVVLEATGVGHGASGRHGRLVVPSLPRVGPTAVLGTLGPEVGGRLLRLVADGAALFTDTPVTSAAGGDRWTLRSPGWLAPIGCNGRGVALATGLGETVGRYLATGDAVTLPVPLVRPHARAGAALLPLVPQLLLPFGDWQDRRLERRGEA